MALERLQAAGDGLNTDAAPDYVAKAQAPVHENLMTRDGKLVVRGGITNGVSHDTVKHPIASVVPSDTSPQAPYAYITEPFNESAGNLTGKLFVASDGSNQTWTLLDGTGNDFVVDATNHNITRSTATAALRVDYLWPIRLGAVQVQVNFKSSVSDPAGMAERGGLVARAVDDNNYLWCEAAVDDANGGASGNAVVRKKVNGVTTDLFNEYITNFWWGAATNYYLRLVVRSNGDWEFWATTVATNAFVLIASGNDPDLATGGALSRGGVGIWDSRPTGAAGTHTYDDFSASLIEPAPMIVSRWLQPTQSGFPFLTDPVVHLIDQSGGVIANASFGDQKKSPTTRGAPLNSYVYFWGGQSTDFQERFLCRWSNRTGSPELFAGSAETAPKLTGRYGDITTHLNRLLVLGGTLNGNGGVNSIMWSDALTGGDPTDTTHAAWKDDVSGLYNVIQLQGDDLPVAWGRVGRYQAILKERTVWMLTGDAPSAFSLRKIADNVRVFPDSRAVCSIDDGCYFLSDRGLMYIDGSQVLDASGDVRAELVAAIAQARADWIADATGYAHVSYLPGNCLMVCVGKQTRPSVGETVATTYFAGTYDMARRTWSRFSTGVSSGSAPVFVEQFAGHVYGIDTQGHYLLDTVAQPGTLSFSGAHVEDDDPHSANGLRIPAKWYTRLAKLASPGLVAKVRRVFLDYRFVSAALSSGFLVKVVDGLGNVLLAQAQVPAMTSTTQARQRAVFDVNDEASDVQVQVEWSGSWTSSDQINFAEMHDVAVEFDPAQQRASGF